MLGAFEEESRIQENEARKFSTEGRGRRRGKDWRRGRLFGIAPDKVERSRPGSFAFSARPGARFLFTDVSKKPAVNYPRTALRQFAFPRGFALDHLGRGVNARARSRATIISGLRDPEPCPQRGFHRGVARLRRRSSSFPRPPARFDLTTALEDSTAFLA